MLGRTASSLFWMSRYSERAQNIARLVEVSYRLAMVPHPRVDVIDDWRFALLTSGVEVGFLAKHDEVTPRTIIHYMIFDKDNPSSVKTCLEAARNNARSVRTGITSDMWEALNTTWIEFCDVKPQTLTQDRLPEFLSWISQRSQLFRGALLGTTLRNDGYYFSQLGHFLERTDNTARVLDAKYWILLPDHDTIGGGNENYQWSAILRALSGRRSYRFAYPDAKLKALNVAEFLILRKEMPRSLAFCWDWIKDATEDLGQFYGAQQPSHSLALQNWRELSEIEMRDIYQNGLHEFLSDLIGKNNAFANQLSLDYNFA